MRTDPNTGLWIVSGKVDQYSKVNIKIGDEYFPGKWKKVGSREVSFIVGDDPQNTGEGNGPDPASISSPPNRYCKITVSFMQGTFYQGHGQLPNGPSGTNAAGYDSYGLGFTFSGSVASGGIGKIGDDPNPENPKGKWKIYQLTSDYITANGQVVKTEQLHSDFDTRSYYDVSGKNFSWYDHPDSPTLENQITGYRREMNFQVSAYDGKHFCSVTFSATFAFNGQWSIHWKKGY